MSSLDLTLDSDVLVTQANRHRLLPLLYGHLRENDFELVPEAIRESIEAHFHGHALNNFRLASTLVQILKLFENDGIPAIPWKGPVLALMAYGSLVLRPYSDLDVIVPESQIDQAKELLLAKGYRLLRPMSASQEARHRRTFHAYTLMPESGYDAIDLHWRITQHYIPFPFDMAGLWQRLGTLELEGATVPCMSPEDTLLLLCVHGTVHRWSELGWLSDIASLVQRYPKMNWGAVLGHSQTLHSEYMVLLGLCLCQDLLRTELPELVQDRLRSTPLIAKLSARVQSRLWDEPRTEWQRLMHYGLVAHTLSRFPDRVKFWWRTARWVVGERLNRKVQTRLWRWGYR